MRKGLSLIELIFTIVIIAIVFTVIPKIVFSLKKADSFTIRQDAMFNAISMMKMISKLSWDEKNVDSEEILIVNSGNFDCDKNTSRVGSFVGSRICYNQINATNIGTDSGENSYVDFDDVDDFNDYNETTKNLSIYGLHVAVDYIKDSNISYDYANHRAIISIDKDNNSSATTNLKYITVNVSYEGNRSKKGKNLTQFNYTSANIGQMTINKRVWGE